MRKRILALLLVALTVVSAPAQENRRLARGRESYPPELEGARVEVYKTIGDVKLNIYIFAPENHQPTDRRAAIVFFFGGGWRSGSPKQFHEHCKYLAGRGMVAMTADYRVSSRHGTTAVKCVADAKSAIRWVRSNAQRLGVDPNRIAAGGGSAGGHLAAAVGTIPGLDEPGEDTSVSSVPNAMVLFNPAVVLAPVGDLPPLADEQMKGLEERMGIEPVKLSPYHNVKKGAPPAILFHGTGDTTVPFKTAELFAQAMTEAGNTCKLVPFEGRAHGFFNFGRGNGEDYIATVRQMDEFLAGLGFLEGKPTIE
jgi:acetyl esterase/lipase